MGSTSYEGLSLHDAVLRSIEVDWDKKRCVFHLAAFVTPGCGATPHVLAFEGVTFLSVPHEEPWGSSSFVNSVSNEGANFKIEMQSGDVIELTATNFKFSAL